MKRVLIALALWGCSSSDNAAKPTTGADGGSSSGSASSSSSSSGGESSSSSAGGPTDAGTFNDKPACADVPITGDRTSSKQPAPPAVTGVSFVTDWTAQPATGGWTRTQIMDACRYHADGMTWHGKASARVEVRPGDDPLALGAGSERAEMLSAQNASGELDETTASGSVFYATSYRFPSTWDGTFLKGDENSWSFVMQFYPWGGLAAGRSADGKPQTIFLTSPAGDLAFGSGGAIDLGKWTDLVFNVDWSTGHVIAWRRAEPATAFTKEVDAAGNKPTGSVYLKQGLYRGGDVKGRIDILWIGPTARGASFVAVESAAFGTNAGPP
jgi:hypothetical protein